MRVEVTIAGSRLPWRFHGSAALGQWLSGVPWLHNGGMAVLRLGAGDSASRIVPALRAAIRAIDDGRTQLRFCALERDALGDGLLPGLCQELRLTAQSRLEQVQAVWGFCSSDFLICIAGPWGLARHRALLDEAQLLIDAMQKRAEPARITLLLLAPCEAPTDAESFDFCTGEPEEGVLAVLHAEELILWNRYVHLRVGWESAGNLEKVARWSEACAGLRVGADDRLEDVLNQLARQELGRVDDLQSVLRRSVAALTSKDDAADSSVLDTLTSNGLLWCPIGDTGRRPAPWAARALLLDPKLDSGLKTLLRGCLVCRPLARELLTRCFDLEFHHRTKLCLVNGDGVPSDKALESCLRFAECRPGSGRAFYPTAYPSLPDKPIDFMSLGEFRHTMDAHDELRDLNEIRNALAHGHYVSWAMLSRMRQVDR